MHNTQSTKLYTGVCRLVHHETSEICASISNHQNMHTKELTGSGGGISPPLHSHSRASIANRSVQEQDTSLLISLLADRFPYIATAMTCSSRHCMPSSFSYFLECASASPAKLWLLTALHTFKYITVGWACGLINLWNFIQMVAVKVRRNANRKKWLFIATEKYENDEIEIVFLDPPTILTHWRLRWKLKQTKQFRLSAIRSEMNKYSGHLAYWVWVRANWRLSLSYQHQQ